VFFAVPLAKRPERRRCFSALDILAVHRLYLPGIRITL
jgi:hypothetical protein